MYLRFCFDLFKSNISMYWYIEVFHAPWALTDTQDVRMYGVHSQKFLRILTLTCVLRRCARTHTHTKMTLILFYLQVRGKGQDEAGPVHVDPR